MSSLNIKERGVTHKGRRINDVTNCIPDFNIIYQH